MIDKINDVSETKRFQWIKLLKFFAVFLVLWASLLARFYL